MIKFSKTRQDFYPLGGGLDLVSPAIQIDTGKLIDCQNYEPAIGGGYRRSDGFERYSGLASPSSASYYYIPYINSGTIVVGNQIVGNTSAATGYVLGIFTNYLIIGRAVGTFINGEVINISAVNVGTITAIPTINGAQMPSDHADYSLLAANDQRTLILAVPGSGRIRGVTIYNDIVYAFRDNAGGTAGVMYKATNTGWVAITFGFEVPFTSATAQINVGDTIVGGTSAATGVVTVALLRTGTWTVNGVGSLILTSITGSFISGEAIKVSAVSRATTSSVSTAITRAPGGNLETFRYNFTGSTNSEKLYGCDGVNPVFEFDGTTYVPIRTGMSTEAPSHVIAHKGFLFLSFLGSVQYSALGNPYAWTVVLGSGEIDLSKSVTGFLPQGGNAVGSSLAIFTAERTFVLYGTSSTDFKLVSSIFDVGYSSFTCQQVSNDAYGWTSRGIQALITTLNYGDFDYSSISHMIQPLVTKKRGLECASNSIKTKNQYRIYFTDGTCLVTGITGDKVSGITLLNYGIAVRTIKTATLTTGQEVTYFGSDNGYIYQDNLGTSFDGLAIESWIRLPFNNDQSPRIRKRFRKAIFEMVVDSFSSVNISYDLGYGTYDVMPSTPSANTLFIGSGGYWDQSVWDQFNWDSSYLTTPSISIDGTEKNISFLLYSNRAQDGAHIFSGVTLLSTPRILER